MTAKRQVIYSVAMSLDGFIAGPNGEYDWIPSEGVGVDFEAFLARFDTLLMGRKTYELTISQGPEAEIPGKKRYVFSSQLSAADHPEVTIVPPEQTFDQVRRLKNESGKDLWLFGGGQLFASLLREGLVDEVELAVFPILLGDGVRLLPAEYSHQRLERRKTKEHPGGMLFSNYRVVRDGE
ncbi:MAG: dihydrofolate reductase family protein [Planctomycetota bacterium]